MDGLPYPVSKSGRFPTYNRICFLANEGNYDKKDDNKDHGWDTFFKVLGTVFGAAGAVGTVYAIADHYDKIDRCPHCQQKMVIVKVGNNTYNLKCNKCNLYFLKN